MQKNFVKLFFISLALPCLVACKKEKLEIAFTEINSGTEKNIYNIFKLSRDTLFVCGGESHTGLILQSNNAGDSWKTLYNNFPRPVHSIYFTNSQKGFCGGDSTNIFITDNGGITWSEYSDFTGVPYQYRVPLHKLFSTENANVFAIGGKNFGQGVIYHSSDGGNKWTTHGFEHELRDGAKSSAGIFSVGYGTILESNDNVNWSTSNSTNEYFTGILFTDSTKGFACGYDGGIYKTTDAGKSWSTQKKSNNSVSASRDHFLCMDNFKNTIVICGFGGIMSYSLDNGENWKSGITFNEVKINAVKLLDNKSGIAAGNNGKIYLFQL